MNISANWFAVNKKNISHLEIKQLGGYWDPEEGLKFSLPIEMLPDLVELVRRCHARNKVPLVGSDGPEFVLNFAPFTKEQLEFLKSLGIESGEYQQLGLIK